MLPWPRQTEIPALRLPPLPSLVFDPVGPWCTCMRPAPTVPERTSRSSSSADVHLCQLRSRIFPEAAQVTPGQRHTGTLGVRRLGAKPGQGRCTGPRPALPGLGRASGIKNPKNHGEPCGAARGLSIRWCHTALGPQRLKHYLGKISFQVVLQWFLRGWGCCL